VCIYLCACVCMYVCVSTPGVCDRLGDGALASWSAAERRCVYICVCVCMYVCVSIPGVCDRLGDGALASWPAAERMALAAEGLPGRLHIGCRGRRCYVDKCIARSTEMASVGLLF